MAQQLELVLRIALVGLGAAALMDVWALVLRRGFGVPTLDYALVGRWVGHFPRGRFGHDRIAAAEPIRGERAVGWLVHYAIGVGFATLLVVGWGSRWMDAPTLVPALLVGLVTIAGPWFVMQPAMGLGVAASRSMTPRATRLRNLGTHLVYGAGLYLTALALAADASPICCVPA